MFFSFNWWDFFFFLLLSHRIKPEVKQTNLVRITGILFFSHRALLFSSALVRRWWETNTRLTSITRTWRVKDAVFASSPASRWPIRCLDSSATLRITLPFWNKTALTPRFWKRLWFQQRNPAPTPLSQYHTFHWILSLQRIVHRNLLHHKLFGENFAFSKLLQSACVFFFFLTCQFMFKQQSREWLTLVISCMNWGMNLLPPMMLILTAFSTALRSGVFPKSITLKTL